MNNSKKIAGALGGLLVLACTSGAGAAQAENPVTKPAELEAAGVPVGPMVLYPSVGLQLGRDDNIFFQPSGEKRSGITVLTPVLDFRAVKEGQRYGLLYQAELGRFSDSSPDDYEDQRLAGEADVGFSQKGRLNIQAEYVDEHDPRGTGATEGAPLASANPDRWHATRLGATLAYGAPGAQGRIEAALGTRAKRYDNNRTVTEFRDLDQNDTGVTFFYRVAPRTSLLFQATNADIDYKTATLDSTERRYLVGATWEATAMTTGTVKVGRQQKDFADAGRTDFSGDSWTAAVTWAPKTYSFVEFSANQKTDETNGAGNFNDKRDYGLAWTHGWTSFVRTRLSALSVRDQYKGAAEVTLREDKTTGYGLSVTYQMRRWLNFDLGYTSTDRNSEVDSFDYKRHLYMFSVGASL